MDIRLKTWGHLFIRGQLLRGGGPWPGDILQHGSRVVVRETLPLGGGTLPLLQPARRHLLLQGG